MKQFYLSPIVGTGEENDAYRVAVIDIPGVKRCAAWIPPDTAKSPQNTHAMCLVEMDDFSALDKDAQFTKYDKTDEALSMMADLAVVTAETEVYVKDLGKLNPNRSSKEVDSFAAVLIGRSLSVALNG